MIASGYCLKLMDKYATIALRMAQQSKKILLIEQQILHPFLSVALLKYL